MAIDEAQIRMQITSVDPTPRHANACKHQMKLVSYRSSALNIYFSVSIDYKKTL